MADKTGIEWTDATWNPTTGCDRVSPGCDHCYALTLAARLKGMGSAKYQRDGDPKTSGPGFGLTTHADTLDQPLRWTRPRMVFVNSMSDLFHDAVPDAFIAEVFARMWWSPQHTFQVLTKRHGRMRSLVPRIEADLRQREQDLALVDCPTPLTWPLPNVWLGVSVESQKWASIRVPALLDTPAAIRFLSCEPLLGPVDLHDCNGVDAIEQDWTGGPSGGSGAPHPFVDWVIVGGESGDGARPMHPDWARSLRDQCTAAGVAYHFKQWGNWWPVGPLYEQHDDDGEADDARMDAVAWEMDGREVVQLESSGYIARDHQPGDLRTWLMAHRGKKASGRELDGRTWDEFPARPDG
jgi:protein gp37